MDGKSVDNLFRQIKPRLSATVELCVWRGFHSTKTQLRSLRGEPHLLFCFHESNSSLKKFRYNTRRVCITHKIYLHFEWNTLDYGIDKECSSNEIRCKNDVCADASVLCLYDFDDGGFIIGCRDATHLEQCGTCIFNNIS